MNQFKTIESRIFPFHKIILPTKFAVFQYSSQQEKPSSASSWSAFMTTLSNAVLNSGDCMYTLKIKQQNYETSIGCVSTNENYKLFYINYSRSFFLVCQTVSLIYLLGQVHPYRNLEHLVQKHTLKAAPEKQLLRNHQEKR